MSLNTKKFPDKICLDYDGFRLLIGVFDGLGWQQTLMNTQIT